MSQTDTLIQAFLTAYFGNATNYKYICISTEISSQTLGAALTAGTAPTGAALTFAAGATAAIPAGQFVIDWQQNGVSPQEIVQTTGCALGATSLPVTAIGGGAYIPANNHAVGVSLVQLAPVTDNPSASPAGAQYLTLVAADFGSVSGSGVGNRQIVATKKFPGASTTAGSYTAVRLSNANPIVAGSVGVTSFIPKAVINPTTDQTFPITIKE